MAEQLYQGKESVIGQPAGDEYIPGQRIREEAHGQLNFDGMERPVEDSGSLMPDPRTTDSLNFEDDIVWIHDPQDFDFVRVTTMHLVMSINLVRALIIETRTVRERRSLLSADQVTE